MKNLLLFCWIYYGDCYAVEIIYPLIYVALRALKWRGKGFYMSALKNGVLLRNRRAENRPLMIVICSLLLLAPCLSALMISCCKYFLITVKPTNFRVFNTSQGIRPRPSGPQLVRASKRMLFGPFNAVHAGVRCPLILPASLLPQRSFSATGDSGVMG